MVDGAGHPEKWRGEEHGERGDDHAGARIGQAPAIRPEPTDEESDGLRSVEETQRGETGGALLQLKLFAHDRRHPGDDDPADRSLDGHTRHHVVVGARFGQAAHGGTQADRGRSGGTGEVHRVFTRSVAQEEKQQHADRHVRHRNGDVGLAPAVVLRDPAADAADDGAEDHSRQMDAPGQGPGWTEMVVDDEGDAGRDVEGLGQTEQCAQHEKQFKGVHVGRDQREAGPGKQTPDDDGAAAETVGEKPAEGTGQRIEPEERRREQTKLSVRHRNILDDRAAHRGQHRARQVVGASGKP